jgi:flagellar hook-associated protein 2
MGSIVTSGLGSGLDVAGLVQKLVDAEGGPKKLRLDADEAQTQAKLSALGTLRSALSSFRDTLATLKKLESFRGRQATLSSADYLSATPASTAAPGSYAIEVQTLAKAHKLQSASFAASTTVVGTGTLAIVTGGQTYNVVIDASKNTVAGIAGAINASAAGAKVVATVITGTNGAARLTISARETGTANAMTITQSGGDGGLASLVYPGGGGLTQIQAAQNASLLIDGFGVTSSTNTVSGAIAGVDLDLVKANAPGETSTLAIGYNREAARKTIDDFVKSYNGVVDAMKNIASYNSQTKQGGPLFGDAGVRNLVYQLRRELSASVSGLTASFDVLGEIGISAQLDGKLIVNSTQLDAAFNSSFDAIGELFSKADSGVAVKLDKLLEPYLQSGGVLDSRNDSLKSSIDDISDQREALQERLAALQERYTRQFNALDGLLSQLQNTSNFLTQQLAKLPGFTFDSE